MRVGDRERIAPRAVARAEVALEVHTPELVGAVTVGERFGVRRGAPLLLVRVRETGPAQDVAEGACCRPDHSRLQHFQPCLQLPGSPAWVLVPQCQDRVLCCFRGRVRAPMRLAAEIEQPFRPDLLVAVDPAVAGWPRHSKLTAKVRQRHLLLLVTRQELQALIHDTTLFPGHTASSCVDQSSGTIRVPACCNACLWSVL